MKQDAGTIREVLAPKAGALQAIDSAACLQPSSYSISFSSVSSIAGECFSSQKNLSIQDRLGSGNKYTVVSSELMNNK